MEVTLLNSNLVMSDNVSAGSNKQKYNSKNIKDGGDDDRVNLQTRERINGI